MSALPQATIWISPEEYLTGELESDVRHEYVGGRVFAMAGASSVHNRICVNLVSDLDRFLEGHPCEAFSNDMKIRTHREVFYYPDVMVCCDPADNARYYREHPRYVFEVLSDETRRTDEREKALAYFHTPSVEAYILVEQVKMQVTVLRRSGDTWWQAEVLTQPSDVVRLDGLGFEMPLERIYRRTEAANVA